MAGESDSDSESPLLELVIVRPPCRCASRDLRVLFWSSAEPRALCYECLNSVHTRDLTPRERFCYLVLRSLWNQPRAMRRWVFV